MNIADTHIYYLHPHDNDYIYQMNPVFYIRKRDQKFTF